MVYIYDYYSYLLFKLYLLFINVFSFIQILAFIYLYNLLVWVHLSVRLFPCFFVPNKTAEPSRPKFCVGPHVITVKVYEWSKFQKFASFKIQFKWKFSKILKIHDLFLKSANFFVMFYNVHKENMFTIEVEDGLETV